jgi:hypothetical protein
VDILEGRMNKFPSEFKILHVPEAPSVIIGRYVQRYEVYGIDDSKVFINIRNGPCIVGKTVWEVFRFEHNVLLITN